MSAPPSYDSIVQRLNEKVGPNPTPQRVLDAAGTLSSAEIDVLVANAPSAPPPWTPTQERYFTRGVAKEMESAEAEQSLLLAAHEASVASKSIQDMFINLTAELAAIDSQNAPPREGPFAPRLNVLSQEFNRTATDSKILAVKIAVYARKFDSLIIPLSADTAYTPETRLVHVNRFIEEADEFASDAKDMLERFTNLTGDFAIFTGSFSGWANDKEAADSEKLRQAREDLDVLQRRLSSLRVALIALGGVAAATLPVTGVVALFSGPFAGLVVLGGLIAMALSAGAIAGVAISILKCEREIADKQREIRDLAAGISQLKATREELVALGKSYLQDFSGNIDIMAFIWQSAQQDAVRVKLWLEAGAGLVDMPEYMKDVLDNAISTYKLMAKYLDYYASRI